MLSVLILENRNRKRYVASVGKGKRFYVMPNGRLQTGQSSIKLTRVFSRYRPMDFIIKTLFFLLSVLIVFLDTDYENGEFLLVFVKYKCKVLSSDAKLVITNSGLFNLTKTGEVDGKFTVQKIFLLAHVISVFLYSAIVIGLFLTLAIFSGSDALLSALFYVLSGISGGIAAYMIYFTIKRYTKTLTYLLDYYKNYVY